MLIFDKNLFVHEYERSVKIRSTRQFSEVDIELEFLPDVLVLKDGDMRSAITIKPDSVIMITVDQSVGRNAPLSSGEMYLKQNDEMILLFQLVHAEPIADLRKTKTYMLIEHVAKVLSNRYNIPWEYKFEIDTKEKRRSQEKAMLVMVLIFAVLITLAIVYS